MSKKNAFAMADYARVFSQNYKFAIVPLRERSKVPLSDEWEKVDEDRSPTNRHGKPTRGPGMLVDTSKAVAFYEANPRANIGISLGPSRMCSLDIDDADAFQAVLDAYGIDSASLDQYPTIQGSPLGRRVMFRVPEHTVLDYHKLSWPCKDGETTPTGLPKMRAVFELRAAKATGSARFDVLPPSIHPDTQKPYIWMEGRKPPARLEDWPEPPSWLLHIWKSWGTFEPQLKAMCPWLKDYERPEPKTEPRKYELNEGASVIDTHLARVGLESALQQYGYKFISKGRYLSPHSSTGLAGVEVFKDGPYDKCQIYHASDPLNDGKNTPVNAFDLYLHYEHGGDMRSAIKELARIYDIPNKPSRPEPPAPPAFDEPPPIGDEHYLSEEEADELDPPKQSVADSGDEGDEDITSTWPFRPLGYDGGTYFYLPRDTEQVHSIPDRSHTSSGPMLSLAPLHWWDDNFPKSNGTGVDWQAAASFCMELCKRRGIYDTRNIRGRGAWFDAGRSVLHLGNRLIVDSKPVAIVEHKTRYIYERQASTESSINAEPATDIEAQQFAKLVHRLRWQNTTHAVMMTGWCVLAPICGALAWRPHVWLTAQRGAGKSWTQDNIIRPLLGSSALIVQGASTEAGIRQQLRQDARPILFDEAEAEKASGARRIQGVVELARQASSDSSAEIVKGTTSGSGMAFRVRSMFCMGSINVAINQAADESRFTVVQLRTPARTKEAQAEFIKLADDASNLLTPEYCASVRARTYNLIPVIRKNAELLARVVAVQMGSRRMGDQIGTLLAGAISLSISREITEEEAEKYVSAIDLSDATEAEESSDEESLLNVILSHQLRYDGNDNRPTTRNIAEVIQAAMGAGLAVANLRKDDANMLLARHGMRVDDGQLLIAHKHSELERILKDTPWGSGWRRILERLPGAEQTNPRRFAGVQSRSTSVPIETLGLEDDPSKDGELPF